MEAFARPTKQAFLLSKVLTLPFWGVFIALPMILCKELSASTLQIATAIALKPLASLFSPYWSMWIYGRQDRLVPNIFWANVIKYIPFLFFPWISNSWFIVLSIGLYWALKRGVIPAWMEAIKLYIPEEKRSKLFANGSTIEYLGGMVLPLALGFILDSREGAWRWAFFITALIGVLSSYLIHRIPKSSKMDPLPQRPQPWKLSINLLKARPDFTKFQIGFMLGGAGLMLMQPALQKYYVDVLDLSYTKLLTAIAAFKGIGFALTSRSWARIYNKKHIYKICSWVTLTAAIFPLILILSPLNLSFLYLAFLVYGVMQAGSELTWHMSGPSFAGNEDSSIYSATNVLAVGTRGVIFPYLGGLIYSYSGSVSAILAGGALCLFATLYLTKVSPEKTSFSSVK